MSLLNSKFDIVSVDNPLAVAALAQVLDVAPALLPNPTFSTNGTPTAGTVSPGTVVTMDSSGKAVLGASEANVTADQTQKKMAFVVIDGTSDYSGSFVQKLTVLQGGFTMVTDQWYSASPATDFTPGKLVSFGTNGSSNGWIIAATTTNQVIGAVGPAGYDATEGTVQIIVPQGGL